MPLTEPSFFFTAAVKAKSGEDPIIRCSNSSAASKVLLRFLPRKNSIFSQLLQWFWLQNVVASTHGCFLLAMLRPVLEMFRSLFYTVLSIVHTRSSDPASVTDSQPGAASKPAKVASRVGRDKPSPGAGIAAATSTTSGEVKSLTRILAVAESELAKEREGQDRTGIDQEEGFACPCHESEAMDLSGSDQETRVDNR